MALLVGGRRYPSENGKVVEVLSDPFEVTAGMEIGVGVQPQSKRRISCWAQESLTINKVRLSDGDWWFCSRLLIPLRGDPDAKQQPRSADVPKRTKVTP